MIARIKSESVKVTLEQLPELNEVFREVCDKLQKSSAPAIYLLQSGGVLNAFATRFSGRDFVVINSSIYESFGSNSAEMRFLMGHELGHIQRNHIRKHLVLLPGLMLPLLGKAYRRACEATCDRFGAFAADNPDGALRAMMTLSGGKDAAKLMDASIFARQYYGNRDLFASWHELNSGYPTLSQRVAYLQAVKENYIQPSPSRNAFAYFLAFFTSNLPTLIIVFYLAVFAGLVAPALHQSLKRAQLLKERNQIQQPYYSAPTP